jgi:hypothetical protein
VGNGPEALFHGGDFQQKEVFVRQSMICVFFFNSPIFEFEYYLLLNYCYKIQNFSFHL